MQWQMRSSTASFAPSLNAFRLFVLSLLVIPVLCAVTWFRTSRPTNQQTVTTTHLPDECVHPPFNSCTFYAQCLESRYQCGPTGYPIGYGQTFCERFSADRSRLTPAGQEWMLRTMHCLQLALVPEATGAVNMTCDELKVKALNTHPKCYVGSGFCSLKPLDWLGIIEIVELKTLFHDWETFKVTVETGEDCVDKAWLQLVGKDLL